MSFDGIAKVNNEWIDYLSEEEDHVARMRPTRTVRVGRTCRSAIVNNLVR